MIARVDLSEHHQQYVFQVQQDAQLSFFEPIYEGNLALDFYILWKGSWSIGRVGVYADS